MHVQGTALTQGRSRGARRGTRDTADADADARRATPRDGAHVCACACMDRPFELKDAVRKTFLN